MTCSPCQFEQEPFDPASPGLVEDVEWVCRAAFTPLHGTAEVKANFLRDRDLLAGELSVWRWSEKCAPTIEDVKKIQFIPAQNDLWKIFAANVGAVRQLSLEDTQLARSVCVIDDPRTDHVGGTHAWHAVLAICKKLGELDKDSLQYRQIKTDLSNLFKQNVAWPPQGSGALAPTA